VGVGVGVQVHADVCESEVARVSRDVCQGLGFRIRV
jgi:hypothetical protein